MTQSNFFRATKFLAIIGIATTLAACAPMATGPKFAGVEPSAADKGDVYLYRGSAFFAMAQVFGVAVDDKPVANLVNNSYIRLRLPPGGYKLKVSPGGLAKTSELPINVTPGANTFYEYDFVTGPFANIFFIGSAIEPREQNKALAALKELQASSAP